MISECTTHLRLVSMKPLKPSRKKWNGKMRNTKRMLESLFLQNEKKSDTIWIGSWKENKMRTQKRPRMLMNLKCSMMLTKTW